MESDFIGVVTQCPFKPIDPPYTHPCEHGRMHLFVDENTFLKHVHKPNTTDSTDSTDFTYGRSITVLQGKTILRDEVMRLWSQCVRNYVDTIQIMATSGVGGAHAMGQLVKAMTSILRTSPNYTTQHYNSEHNFLGDAFQIADEMWKPNAVCGDSVAVVTAEGETLRFYVWSAQLYRQWKPGEESQDVHTMIVKLS